MLICDNKRLTQKTSGFADTARIGCAECFKDKIFQQS